MPGWTTTCFQKRKPGRPSLVLLVLVLSLAIIWVGCLVWIGNAIAIIPDNDPGTFVTMLSLGGSASHGDLDHIIQSDRHDSQACSGQPVVYGNGDQDDNREEYFTFLPLTGALGQSGLRSVSANYTQIRQLLLVAPASKIRTAQQPKPRPNGFTQRRTAVAYKDFGHLKVMSAEGGNFGFVSPSLFIRKATRILWAAFLIVDSANRLIR